MILAAWLGVEIRHRPATLYELAVKIYWIFGARFYAGQA